ncbi:TetR/AcrR family transcriptional regulator C-terminal domain-containing protein [Streptomyces sp. NPDC051569]|uniref:TetR/AcrR family transcriptional regulator C-terminal domain-containing protein n=1 Tax=Streptomyces sp. NPDC051569 TaxID=3365661 RepID=UPI00378F1F02
MTKSQAQASRRVRLDVGAVVRAALRLLEDKGADGVSVRGTADLLGVRMNTVLWHAKTKPRLVELMADAIIGEVSVAGLPEPGEERARELACRYRGTLLAHRDGARIVAGTYPVEPATLGFADLMVESLLAAGRGEREAVWVCWSVLYFVLGLTQEEQSFPRADQHRFRTAVTPADHPSLHRVVAHFEEASFDDRFDHGLSLLLRARPGQGD